MASNTKKREIKEIKIIDDTKRYVSINGTKRFVKDKMIFNLLKNNEITNIILKKSSNGNMNIFYNNTYYKVPTIKKCDITIMVYKDLKHNTLINKTTIFNVYVIDRNIIDLKLDNNKYTSVIFSELVLA